MRWVGPFNGPEKTRGSGKSILFSVLRKAAHMVRPWIGQLNRPAAIKMVKTGQSTNSVKALFSWTASSNIRAPLSHLARAPCWPKAMSSAAISS